MQVRAEEKLETSTARGQKGLAYASGNRVGNGDNKVGGECFCIDKGSVGILKIGPQGGKGGTKAGGKQSKEGRKPNQKEKHLP